MASFAVLSHCGWGGIKMGRVGWLRMQTPELATLEVGSWPRFQARRVRRVTQVFIEAVTLLIYKILHYDILFLLVTDFGGQPVNIVP